MASEEGKKIEVKQLNTSGDAALSAVYEYNALTKTDAYKALPDAVKQALERIESNMNPGTGDDKLYMVQFDVTGKGTERKYTSELVHVGRGDELNNRFVTDTAVNMAGVVSYRERMDTVLVTPAKKTQLGIPVPANPPNDRPDTIDAFVQGIKEKQKSNEISAAPSKNPEAIASAFARGTNTELTQTVPGRPRGSQLEV